MSLTLLFDADCGFCTKCVDFLKKIDVKNKIRFVPLQDEQERKRFNVSYEQAIIKIYALDDNGTVISGALTVNRSLDVALGINIFEKIYNIFPMNRVQDKIYSIVANNRSKLPGSNGTCAISDKK